MSLRFWRPSVQGRSATPRLVRGVIVLALVVGVLTSSVLLLRPAIATQAQQAHQPGLPRQPSSSTVQTLDHHGTARRLDVFARGTDGTLWHRWTAGTTWTTWESLGGQLDSAPAAVADTSYTGGGFIHVFYRSGNDLMHVVLNACCLQTVITMQENLGYWVGGPTFAECFVLLNCDFGGSLFLTSAPAVTSWGGGRMDVFAFGGSHHLLHRWFEPVLTSNSDDDGWSDWEVLSDADFADDPGAVSWGPGRIDVLVHGSDDGHLYDKVYDAQNGGWSSR